MPDDSFDQLRTLLLDAALPYIAKDGWTIFAFERGAINLKLEKSVVLRAFPDGATDMILHYSKRADIMLVAALTKMNLDDLRVSDRVKTAVRVRFEFLADQRREMRRAFSFLAMPQNTKTAMRCLYHTVDTIWYEAGDKSTDWNFYSKRGLLAGVYAATMLYWFQDESDGFVDTWTFLDRRIADVLKVPRAVDRCRRSVPNPFHFFDQKFAT